MLKKRKRALIMIVSLAIIIGSGISVLGYSLWKNRPEKTVEKPVIENVISQGAFDGMNVKEMQKELNKVQTKHMVTLNILSAITWETPDSYADVGIYNMPDSGYLEQVVLTDQDGNVLYKSPKLQPNEKIEQAKITKKDIKPGNYTCRADFLFYDMETKELQTKQSIDKIQVLVKKAG